MTDEKSDLLKKSCQGWGRAIVAVWQPKEKIKDNFYKDLKENDPDVLVDVLSLMNLEYVERKPAEVMHYIAEKGVLHSYAVVVASKYIPTADWIKELVNFDDNCIDPAMIDEWRNFKQRALAADEDFFEGADFLVKALYCLADTAKLINEYNNPDMRAQFQTDLAQGNILNFVRYCPKGSEIALANLPEDLVFSCNYRKFFDSIDRFKSEKLQQFQSSTILEKTN